MCCCKRSGRRGWGRLKEVRSRRIWSGPHRTFFLFVNSVDPTSPHPWLPLAHLLYWSRLHTLNSSMVVPMLPSPTTWTHSICFHFPYSPNILFISFEIFLSFFFLWYLFFRNSLIITIKFLCYQNLKSGIFK